MTAVSVPAGIVLPRSAWRSLLWLIPLMALSLRQLIRRRAG